MRKKYSLGKKAIEDLANYKEAIEKELTLFFDGKLKEAKDKDKIIVDSIEVVKEFTLRGGKRIRAALVYYGYLCFSNRNLDEVVKASMSMELAQSYLLIHDDIVDRDDLRRGRGTLHKIFEETGRKQFGLSNRGKNKEKNHFGCSMAIFIGDICASLADLILIESKIKNRDKAARELSKIIYTVNLGQILDFYWGYEKGYKKDKTLEIYDLKTATYTTMGPLVLGAILAGASDKQLETIRKYSRKLGIAFNIQDDILELFGEKKKYGKPVGSDLKEGKKTLLVIKTLENCSKKEAEFIKSKLGRQDISMSDIEKIKSIMEKSGALKSCINYSKKMIRDAKWTIADQKYNAKGRDFVMGIADYLLEREC